MNILSLPNLFSNRRVLLPKESSRLQEILTNNAKIIEVAPPDSDLAELLVEMGHQNYIGLISNPRKFNTLRAEKPELATYFHNLQSHSQISHNNADVLILSGCAVSCFLSPTYYRRCRHLIIRPTGFTCVILTFLLCVFRLMLGQFKFRCFMGYTTSQGKQRYYWVIDTNNKRPKSSARYYISPKIGVEGFFTSLNNKNIQYTILRWFEKFPHLEKDEDIDLLVADKDFETVKQMLSQKAGIIPVDMYSVSGLSGSDYREMAYYPLDIKKAWFSD